MNATARRIIVTNDIIKVLEERGRKCSSSSDRRKRGLDLVDGYMTWYECVEDQFKQGFRVVMGTGRLRIKICGIGDTQQFPESKAGFDTQKIATAIEQFVDRNKRREEERLAKERTINVNAPLAKKLNQEVGLGNYGSPRVVVDGGGQLCIEMKVTVNERQARKILSAITAALKDVMRVRCVKNEEHPTILTIGKIYDIVSPSNGKQIGVFDDMGEHQYFHDSYFEDC
jgi:hypothetical protein